MAMAQQIVELNVLTARLFTQNRAINESLSNTLYSVREIEDHRMVARQIGNKTSELTKLAFTMHRWSKGMKSLEQYTMSSSESLAARKLCSNGYFIVRAINHIYSENCENGKIFAGQHKPLNHEATDKMLDLFDDITRKIKEIVEDV